MHTRLHSQEGRQQVQKVIDFPLFSGLGSSVQLGVVSVQYQRDVKKSGERPSGKYDV